LKRISFLLLVVLPLIYSCGAGGGDGGSSGGVSGGSGPYVGSINSNKYHYPWCSAAQQINPGNLISFSSPENARASGYVPCLVCDPPWESPPPPPPPPTYGKYNAFCIGVIDGDTIIVLLNGIEERVRLVGVDTPEVGQCFSNEATNFTRGMLENKSVVLEDDKTSLERDVYGRILSYVYAPGNTMANRELVRLGYGIAYIAYPFRYQSEFVSLESSSKNSQIGLWGICR